LLTGGHRRPVQSPQRSPWCPWATAWAWRGSGPCRGMKPWSCTRGHRAAPRKGAAG